jgi:hypothetical protein
MFSQFQVSVYRISSIQLAQAFLCKEVSFLRVHKIKTSCGMNTEP